MIYARQSTAIICTVGPVLDASGVAVTDGVVGDFLISKNGGAPAALNASATLTHRNTGHYSLSLTATDVNTVGTAEIVINDTVNACPIKEITVVEPATYDVLFADAAPGPASPTNITAGTVTTATNVTTVNGLAANVITAAATAADFGTEIAGAVWDLDATAHQTQGTFGQAIGDPAADTNTIYKAVVTDAAGATVGVDVVAIQADTDNIQTRLPAALVAGRMDASVGAMAADVLTAAATAADFTTEIQSGLATAAGVSAVETDTQDIQARLPAALVGGRIDASVGALAANVVTAAATAADFVAEVQAGLSVLDAAGVRSAVGLAAANLDTQLADLPTNAELATTEVLANVKKVNGVTIVGDGSATPFNV